jgi:glycosyl transferase family 87
MRALVKNLLLVAVLAGLLVYLARRFPGMEKGTDFPDFYVAAKMVRKGAGQQLYSAAVQREFQIRYAGRVGTFFIHPPFETLLYLPFTQWPLERAYLLWSLVNVGLLLVAARVMVRHVLQGWDWQMLAAGALLFAPVLLNFVQGQDSVLLLLLLVLAFAALKREQPMVAGMWLACGLFKFHLVLPILLVLLFRKRWRLLGGFAAGAVVLVSVSAAISGVGWLAVYARFLTGLSKLPMAGIHPEEMANLWGLATLLSPPSAWIPLTVACSLAVLGLAIRGWSRAGMELGFANVVVAATLVSYHLSPHDLTVVLLPMALVWHHACAASTPKWRRWIQVTTVIILFLPPLHLWLLGRHEYRYMAILTVILFSATCTEIDRVPGIER